MSETRPLNQCNNCGKFRRYSELVSQFADDGSSGQVQWLECKTCQELLNNEYDEILSDEGKEL